MTSVLGVLVLVAGNAGWASADNYHDPGLLQVVFDDALFVILWTVIYYIAVGYFPMWFALNTALVFCIFFFLAGWGFWNAFLFAYALGWVFMIAEFLLTLIVPFTVASWIAGPMRLGF